MKETQADRLRKAMKLKGFQSAAQLARRLEYKDVTVRAHLNEVSGIPAKRAKDYARVLGITPEWLLYGDNASQSPQSPAEIEMSSVPVVGTVQAGVWLEVDGFHGDAGDEERLPVVPNPRYARFKQWAVKVVGDSVNKRIDDGAFAHCVDMECGKSPKDGDLVVVERFRDDGGLVETTIKEVRINGVSVELWPCSTNPAHTGPISLGDGEETTSARIKGFVIGSYREFE